MAIGEKPFDKLAMLAKMAVSAVHHEPFSTEIPCKQRI